MRDRNEVSTMVSGVATTRLKVTNHTAVFVHADFDKPPNCSEMTSEEHDKVIS